VIGSNIPLSTQSLTRIPRWPSVPLHNLRNQKTPPSFAARSEPRLPVLDLDSQSEMMHISTPRHLFSNSYPIQSNKMPGERLSVSNYSVWHIYFQPLQDGAEFWAAYVNNETISFNDLISNLNQYIIEKCKLTERGIFWNGSDRSDNDCNELTRKELRLWFDHWLRNQVQLDQSIHSHYQQYKTRGLVHVQQFAWIWEKRLHSLVPTIRHLGQEWETRGAIAGFADKEQCLMKIAQGELWSFIVRFPMTRHHAVSVVLHDKKSGKGAKTKVRSIILNILDSNEIFGSRKMNTNFQGCILGKKLFKLVYSWHHERFMAKEKLFKERLTPLPTPLYNCCSFDKITKKMELNRRRIPLQNRWSS